MKKKFIGIIGAVSAITLVTAVTASADYYVDTTKTDDTVIVSVIADKSALAAMEFTVTVPDEATVIETKTISGALYNEANGKFAWAGIEAPADGTEMFSITVSTKDSGNIVFTPSADYEEDFAKAISVEIKAEDEGDDSKPDYTSPDDTSETSETPTKPSDSTEDDSNPNTGVVTLASTLILVAGAGLAISFKRKK